jgi:hypothetical protein
VCQLCDEPGHLASRCFKRFQRDFLGVGNDGRFTARQLAMANAVSHSQPSSSSVDPRWYVDIGATDHLTNDFEKMQVKEPYTGQEQVHVANGTGMRICHIADIFTKPLPLPLFSECKRNLNMHSIVEIEGG